MVTLLTAFKLVAALAIIASFVWLSLRLRSPGAVTGLVQWALSNQNAVRRGLAIAQVAAGLALCGLGYAAGREHLHLILDGSRTQGRIISYRQVRMPNSGGATWDVIALPKVEFVTDGQTFHFEDWMGSESEVLNLPVLVLYDPSHPATAMIDRRVMNWVPWAPMIAVGMLLLASAARRGIRGMRQKLATTTTLT